MTHYLYVYIDLTAGNEEEEEEREDRGRIYVLNYFRFVVADKFFNICYP